MVEWFLDSLRREILDFGKGLQIRTVMVDFYADERQGQFGFDFHVPPKPNVWQGPHRLTTQDYFAASNARNTALCLALEGWLLVVDDLSVLMPGYFKAVREAMEGGYIACGAYIKGNNLKVFDGRVISYEPNPVHVDVRWPQGRDDGPVSVPGGYMYGCSSCTPVEALLQINGWDEYLDIMGLEDCTCGIMLQGAGWSLKYDRRMLAIESYELHFKGKQFIRLGKHDPIDQHVELMKEVYSGKRTKAVCYYPEGLREVRRQVLDGKPFPVLTQPTHDWRDGQPLCEM